MKPVRFDIEDYDYQRYARVKDKAHMGHRDVYLYGIAAAEAFLIKEPTDDTTDGAQDI